MRNAPRFDQLIINEYMPGQGINKHVDRIDIFENYICSLSLGSDCVMTFAKGNEGDKSIFTTFNLLFV
jgi:alkylated DNA repair dioxygenase AlkB